jgi:hypothetical protein
LPLANITVTKVVTASQATTTTKSYVKNPIFFKKKKGKKIKLKLGQ